MHAYILPFIAAVLIPCVGGGRSGHWRTTHAVDLRHEFACDDELVSAKSPCILLVGLQCTCSPSQPMAARWACTDSSGARAQRMHARPHCPGGAAALLTPAGCTRGGDSGPGMRLSCALALLLKVCCCLLRGLGRRPMHVRVFVCICFVNDRGRGVLCVVLGTCCYSRTAKMTKCS
jgi:hypothetical protein